MSSQKAPDFVQPHYFYDTVFEDCDQAAMVYFPSPNKGWANIADCGNFPCTAPHNLLWQFYNTKWIWS
jgi:hypothetical protein